MYRADRRGSQSCCTGRRRLTAQREEWAAATAPAHSAGSERCRPLIAVTRAASRSPPLRELSRCRATVRRARRRYRKARFSAPARLTKRSLFRPCGSAARSSAGLYCHCSLGRNRSDKQGQGRVKARKTNVATRSRQSVKCLVSSSRDAIAWRGLTCPWHAAAPTDAPAPAPAAARTARGRGRRSESPLRRRRTPGTRVPVGSAGTPGTLWGEGEEGQSRIGPGTGEG